MVGSIHSNGGLQVCNRLGAEGLQELGATELVVLETSPAAVTSSGAFWLTSPGREEASGAHRPKSGPSPSLGLTLTHPPARFPQGQGRCLAVCP